MYNIPTGPSYSTPNSYGKRYRDDEDDSYDGSGRSGYRRRRDDYENSPSGYRGGRAGRRGGRGGFHRDRQSQNAAPVQTSLDRFKEAFFAWAADIPHEEDTNTIYRVDLAGLKAMRSFIEREWTPSRPDILLAFRHAITEQPHKAPHFAALLAMLTIDPLLDIKPLVSVSAGDTVQILNATQKDLLEPARVMVGLTIVEDLGKFLQDSIDALDFRSARLVIQFLAILSKLPRPLVTADSFLSTLNSLAAIVSTPGLGIRQGDQCVRLLVAGLIHSEGGASNEAKRSEIVATLRHYVSKRKVDRTLLSASPGATQQLRDPIVDAVEALQDKTPITCLAESSVLSSMEAGQPFKPIELQAVTLPSGPHDFGFVAFQHTLFDDESVPSRTSKAGFILRNLVSDLIAIFDPNRKIGARTLLDLRQWLPDGVFKPASGPSDTDSVLSLENLIVESVLAQLFALPAPEHTETYFGSLLVEMCILAPALVAPPIGKCVRKLFNSLGAQDASSALSLDAEGVRRFALWFSQHVSNFNFQWKWADWQNDLLLPDSHPKRVLIDQLISLEVRLSYFDRIKLSLPEAYHAVGVMAEGAPGSNFEYEQPDHPNHVFADIVVGDMRNRAPPHEILEKLSRLQEVLIAEQGQEELEAELRKCDLAVECLLEIGSRSFSHTLNIVERYLELLRQLSHSPQTRMAMLRTIAKFWRRHPHYIFIVMDKFLQYRIVTPADIVAWVFERDGAPDPTWHHIVVWDILRATIEKVRARVIAAEKRVKELKSISNSMEVDGPHAAVEELQQAEKNLKLFEENEAQVMRDCATRFAKATDNVTLDEWQSWWLDGWYRQFARQFSKEITHAVDSTDKYIVAAKQWAHMSA
ncbi:hypothetical protein E5Q_04848 [Mixia osmundae IAM 14324]|uniref:MIF4G domain-containing protein n=1 Tax=Mixia osmundae (strain CBS 9802 / IAM 14324 / JCM 22182 / KY 12970) TaxID=764103 RepID=G7E5Q5_MIXOS|nr:hypothetical protein E5Q_04848 [Mixia osmundae IAM 14324]